MTDASQTGASDKSLSELDHPRWSVVSFDECEASGLTYSAAVDMLEEKEAAGVHGLCIVTDEVASKVGKRQSR